MAGFEDIDFMWHGGETRRYHGFRMLMEDTVGHHSYNVVCIILKVMPEAPAHLLRAAIKHDMSEHIVGDMPAPSKRDMPHYVLGGEDTPSVKTFREVFAEYEDATARAHGVALEEDLTPEEAWLLKFADSLDGMRFCLNERHLGNQHPRLVRCYHTFESYVEKLLWGDDPPRNYVDRRMTPVVAPANAAAKDLFMELKGRWYDVHERK